MTLLRGTAPSALVQNDVASTHGLPEFLCLMSSLVVVASPAGSLGRRSEACNRGISAKNSVFPHACHKLEKPHMTMLVYWALKCLYQVRFVWMVILCQACSPFVSHTHCGFQGLVCSKADSLYFPSCTSHTGNRGLLTILVLLVGIESLASGKAHP